MHRSILPVALALGVAMAAPAVAHDFHIDHDQCNYQTSYDVFVTDAGVRFQRDDGTPSKVFMHDGQLRVDGRDVAVSAADAERLRRYEADVRAAVPELAGIAREGLDIGFSAMTTVAATFAENGDQRSELLDRLNRKHAVALRSIDATLGRGEWREDALDDTVENAVEGTVQELVGTVTAGAVKAALSGDQGQLAALQARADSLDKAIEDGVEKRADKLSDRADLLCKRFDAMAELQQQWQFRQTDGSRLELLRKQAPHDGDGSDDADHAHVAAR